MSVVRAEEIAVQSLREYLLRALPGTVTTVNASRAAVLKSARVGPFTIPAAATLKLGTAPGAAAIPITTGSRTAAQVATDITTAAPAGLSAAADSDGRLVVTATAAPVAGTPSTVYLDADSTSTASVLGWDEGGERMVVSALVPPTYKGVADGWPVGDSLELGPGFWVVIDDRTSDRPENIRKYTHLVTLELSILRSDDYVSDQRTREHIHACVRAVREAILTDRLLGSSAAGIMGTFEMDCRISGRPLQWPNGPLFDVAALRLQVIVYERFGT